MTLLLATSFCVVCKLVCFSENNILFLRYHLSVSFCYSNHWFGNFLSHQGAVGLRVRVYDRIMCFVNCHFAAHLDAVGRRNADFDHVYRTMSFSRPTNLLNATHGTLPLPITVSHLPYPCIYLDMFIDLACHWSFMFQLETHLLFKCFVVQMYVHATHFTLFK